MSTATDLIGKIRNTLTADELALFQDLMTGNADREFAAKSVATGGLTATTVTAGNLAGALAGSLQAGAIALDYQGITASGAINSNVSWVELSKADGALAVTLASPTTGRILIINQADAGTSGHTVTLTSGTWDGTNDVANFNAQGETLIVLGLSVARFLVLVNNGGVTFS